MPKKSPFKLLPLQKGPTHRVVCSLCPWVANAKSQEEVFAAFEDHVFVAHPSRSTPWRRNPIDGPTLSWHTLSRAVPFEQLNMPRLHEPGSLSGNALRKVEEAVSFAIGLRMLAIDQVCDYVIEHDACCVSMHDKRRACDCDPNVFLDPKLTAPGPSGVQ